MSGRTAGSRDVAPKVRGAFKRALLVLDGEQEAGSGLTELLVASLKEDVKGTLGAISKFVPKELDIDADIVAKELTRADLEAKLLAQGFDITTL